MSAPAGGRWSVDHGHQIVGNNGGAGALLGLLLVGLN